MYSIFKKEESTFIIRRYYLLFIYITNRLGHCTKLHIHINNELCLHKGLHTEALLPSNENKVAIAVSHINYAKREFQESMP